MKARIDVFCEADFRARQKPRGPAPKMRKKSAARLPGTRRPVYFRASAWFKESALMRHAFRAFGICALCLVLMPFFRAPAHAANGKTGIASDPVSEQAPAVPAKAVGASRQAPKSNPKAGQHPEGEDVAAAQAHNGWIKLESGSRQAYVGIHGGTAPLSLMRSSDGVLFAFTGQTGNDFLHVLKGGNASRQAAEHSGQNALAPGHKKEPEAKHAASASQEAERRHESAGKPSAAPTVADGTAVQSAPASKVVASAGADKTASAGAPAPAAGPAPAKAESAGTGQPPAKGEVLVFASGDVKDTSEGYKPFGLTPPAGMSPEDSRRQSTGLPPGQTESSYFGKPLKLGSYQAILNAGKV